MARRRFRRISREWRGQELDDVESFRYLEDDLDRVANKFIRGISPDDLATTTVEALGDLSGEVMVSPVPCSGEVDREEECISGEVAQDVECISGEVSREADCISGETQIDGSVAEQLGGEVDGSP